MSELTNYFAVLGLTLDATEQEIRDAYRRLAKRHHPDSHSARSNVGHGRMQLINEAKAVLLDEHKRADHRRKLLVAEELQRTKIESFRTRVREQEVLQAELTKVRVWTTPEKRRFAIGVASVTIALSCLLAFELLNSHPTTVSPIEQIIERHSSPESGKPKEIRVHLSTDSLPLLKHEAEILLSIGSPDAPAYFERCIALEPGNDTLLHDLSMAWFKIGRFDKAFDVLSKGAEGDSDRIAAYAEFGDMFIHMEKPLDARNAFEATIELADSVESATSVSRSPRLDSIYRHAVRKLHKLR